jgi:hypothetical protein
MGDDPKKREFVPFELVGGPYDGEVHYCRPGVMTIMIPHGIEIHCYKKDQPGTLKYIPMAGGQRKK